MRRHAWLPAVLLAWFVAARCQALDDAAIFQHKPGIWAITGTAKLNRWIVIHGLAESEISGVFHIEVIGREKGKPAWDIKHLCNHMAITLAALKKSVTKALKSGAVYPESFISGFAAWQQQPELQRAICARSVLECLRAP
jgi:hypothetical protein